MITFRKLVKAGSGNMMLDLKQVSFKNLDIPYENSPEIKDIKDEWRENQSKGLANHGKFGKKTKVAV